MNIVHAQAEFIGTLEAIIAEQQRMDKLEQRENALELLVENHFEMCSSCTLERDAQDILSCIMRNPAWLYACQCYGFNWRDVLSEIRFAQRVNQWSKIDDEKTESIPFRLA